MHSFMLSDWITLRGTSTLTSIVQSDAGYLDMSAYEDFAAWVQVAEVTSMGGVPVLYLETAPLKEEALFAPTNTWRHTAVPLAPGVITAKNMLNAGLAWQVPLARWLRWRMSMAGASSAWSVTFRVFVTAQSQCLPNAG